MKSGERRRLISPSTKLCKRRRTRSRISPSTKSAVKSSARGANRLSPPPRRPTAAPRHHSVPRSSRAKPSSPSAASGGEQGAHFVPAGGIGDKAQPVEPADIDAFDPDLAGLRDRGQQCGLGG